MKKLKHKAFEDARFAWMEAGRPKSEKPVILHLIVRRCRQMDEDNIWAGLKWHKDGLFVRAITHDDAPQYVRCGHIEQQIDSKFKLKPEVIFIVEEL